MPTAAAAPVPLALTSWDALIDSLLPVSVIVHDPGPGSQARGDAKGATALVVKRSSSKYAGIAVPALVALALPAALVPVTVTVIVVPRSALTIT